jgi:hypothetical protein
MREKPRHLQLLLGPDSELKMYKARSIVPLPNSASLRDGRGLYLSRVLSASCQN